MAEEGGFYAPVTKSMATSLATEINGAEFD